MTVPARPFVSTAPDCSSSLYARAAVFAAMPRCAARVRSGGNRVPTAASPELAAPSTACLICSNGGTELDVSSLSQRGMCSSTMILPSEASGLMAHSPSTLAGRNGIYRSAA